MRLIENTRLFVCFLSVRRRREEENIRNKLVSPKKIRRRKKICRLSNWIYLHKSHLHTLSFHTPCRMDQNLDRLSFSIHVPIFCPFLLVFALIYLILAVKTKCKNRSHKNGSPKHKYMHAQSICHNFLP